MTTFQAYGVGLPKTGSTTLAAAFVLSRSSHEWANYRLFLLGKARVRGDIDDTSFWRLAGGRLRRPVVAMDVCTAHHLYADALADRFPEARFVWTTRGVRDWSNSLLDMHIREDAKTQECGLAPVNWQRRFPDECFSSEAPHAKAPDADMLPSLIRSWSEHMRRMASVLPADRTLRVAVKDLSARLPEISSFVGADDSRLIPIPRAANARPAGLEFDRWTHRQDWRPAYDLHAADLMQEWFPDEHAAITGLPPTQVTESEATAAWTDYLDRTAAAMTFTSPQAKAAHRRRLSRLLAIEQACNRGIAAQHLDTLRPAS